MKVVVSYDVKISELDGARRLRRVSKLCQDYGVRVQFSVFECVVDPAQWQLLRHKLINEIDPDQDSIRFYFLGSNWKNRIEYIGVKKNIDVVDDTLIL